MLEYRRLALNGQQSSKALLLGEWVCFCTCCVRLLLNWADGSWEVNTALFSVIQAATSTSHPLLAAVSCFCSVTNDYRLLPTLGAVSAEHSAEHCVSVRLPNSIFTVRLSVSTDLHYRTIYSSSAFTMQLKTNPVLFHLCQWFLLGSMKLHLTLGQQ